MQQTGRLSALLLLVVVACAASAPAAPPQEKSAPVERIEAARLDIANWRLDAASKTLDSIRKSHPEDVEAAVLLAMIHGLRLDYARADALFQQAAATSEDDPFLLIGKAWLLSRAEMPERTDQALARLRRVVKSNKDLAACLARSPVALHRLAARSRRIELALTNGREDPAARVVLAHYRLRKGGIEQAAELAAQAAAANPRQADALRILHHNERRRGDLKGAGRTSRRILELDPYDFVVRRALCEYLGTDPLATVQRAPNKRVWKLLDEAESQLRSGRKREARAALREAMTPSTRAGQEQQELTELVRCGVLCLGLQQTDDAIRLGRQAVRLQSDDVLGHLFLSEALIHKHHVERFRIGGENWVAIYAEQPSPTPEGIQRLFTSYAELLPHERRVVDRATHPMRHLIPRMVAAGARHLIIPLHRRLTDLPEFKAYRFQSTPDGRSWPGLRGVGDRLNTATGIETLWETGRCGHSTVAHEFGHQVFRHGFTPEQQAEVTERYLAAVRDHKTLDEYSRTNVDEYFAQSYEAYVSPRKRPSLTPPMGNTRDRLRKCDYAMFALLRRLTT